MAILSFFHNAFVFIFVFDGIQAAIYGQLGAGIRGKHHPGPNSNFLFRDVISLTGNLISWQSTEGVDRHTCRARVFSHAQSFHRHVVRVCSHAAHSLRFAQNCVSPKITHTSSRNDVYHATLDDTKHGHSFLIYPEPFLQRAQHCGDLRLQLSGALDTDRTPMITRLVRTVSFEVTFGCSPKALFRQSVSAHLEQETTFVLAVHDFLPWLKLQDSPLEHCQLLSTDSIFHFLLNADFAPFVTLDRNSCLNPFILGFEVARPDHLISMSSYHDLQSLLAWQC